MVNDAKMRKFDDSLFDVIVFDEIFKNDLIILNKIKHYVEENPDKIILATGDTDQNKPVNLLSTEIEHKEHAYHCVSMLFPKQIKLKINKRLDSEEGRKLIEDVKTDFLDKKIPLIKSIEKYFKFTDHPSDNNISYRNEVAEDVSRTKRNLLGKTSEYELGEKLLCKDYIKTKGFIKLQSSDEPKKMTYKCNKNCSYIITEITDDTITIKDTYNDIVATENLININEEYNVIRTKNNYTVISFDVFITLPIYLIKSKFTYAYCRTGDSIQGITINTAITIYDWNLYYASREWVWTALTRATDFNKVYFYNGKSPEFDHERLRSYFKKKVAGYIDQDKQAKRKIDKENYVTVDWMIDAFGSNCCRCKCTFSFKVTNSVECDFTANRLDNDICHSLDNVEPMCYSCNRDLSNK